MDIAKPMQSGVTGVRDMYEVEQPQYQDFVDCGSVDKRREGHGRILRKWGAEGISGSTWSSPLDFGPLVVVLGWLVWACGWGFRTRVFQHQLPKGSR